ncbi:hypothetical protein [Streptomyces sp. NBC_00859]|uniref:hypothetical protein n=1 Tax=Streptomyces sp. NBC_00859 TaxID=2903682 RepID=UPI00386DE5DD|nr:hypothetical protein OG584_10450 [Streptomyces sp. NBC_00859]
MPELFRLGRRSQFSHGDLTLGIVRTSTDPDDPYARVNIVDRSSDFGEIRDVRAGDEVRTGAHVLAFAEVVPGTRDGHIAFTIERLQQ